MKKTVGKLFLAVLLCTLLCTLPSIAAPANISPEATVTASSSYDTNWAEINVTDGVIGIQDTGEWASAGEINPWIKFEWAEAKLITKLVIYDRNNEADHSEYVTLTFSDGTKMEKVGPLANTGEAFEVAVNNVVTTSILIEIAGTDTSVNNGLSEVEIYGEAAPAAPAETEAPAETAAPVVDTPAPAPVAAQTSDIGVVVFAAFVLVAGAVAVAGKLNKK